jgi:hypothetical protein
MTATASVKGTHKHEGSALGRPTRPRKRKEVTKSDRGSKVRLALVKDGRVRCSDARDMVAGLVLMAPSVASGAV